MQPVLFAMPFITGWCWSSMPEVFGSAVLYQRQASQDMGVEPSIKTLGNKEP